MSCCIVNKTHILIISVTDNIYSSYKHKYQYEKILFLFFSFFNTLITKEVVNASIWFSKENNNIKISSIHMAVIRIIIFISKMCFYLLIIFKMLWHTTSITQMAFTFVMIIYILILHPFIYYEITLSLVDLRLPTHLSHADVYTSHA